MFHILVVDDDKNTRRLMRAVLEAEHYTVTTAADGEEALAALDHEHVDLIVLDVMMPRMDGYAFTAALREGRSDLPILMVSARQLPADRKQGFLVGTDDYMTKPVDTEEMLLRIRALLRRARIVSERKIVIVEQDRLRPPPALLRRQRARRRDELSAAKGHLPLCPPRE